MQREPARDYPVVVATMPITASHRRVAVAIIVGLLAAAALAAPFAHLPMPRIDTFIPVLQTVICFIDLITAIFLFAQYRVEPRLAILVLAGGYIASGMFAFIQTLAFPGAYSPTGLFGDGRNTGGWFFVWWHTTFPAAVIIYGFLKNRNPPNQAARKPFGVMIGITVACVAAWIAALTWLAAQGTSYLPDIFTPTNIFVAMPLANQLNLLMLALGATAITVLFFRRSTILDVWLMVTLFAWMPNFIVGALLPVHRFSLGWYTARGFALFASCTVLAVLLIETMALYARLANSVTLLRRERANRLMSLDAATGAMAHEIRQPLTAVVSLSAAGTNWLKASPPDLEKARQCLNSINGSAHRANEIIQSVRSIFKQSAAQKESIRVNDIALQVLDLMHQDITRHQVNTETDFENGLPDVHVDRVQLQQVVLNLVKNAIDAMDAKPTETRYLRVQTKMADSNSVMLSVHDTGPGIREIEREQVFDPFFTTKKAGMGLGLSISQTIVNEHGGLLRLASAEPTGCRFEIILPVADVTEDDSRQ